MDLGITFKREYKAVRDCCSCRTLVFPGHTHTAAYSNFRSEGPDTFSPLEGSCVHVVHIQM